MKKEPNKKTVAMFIILGFILMIGLILKQISDKLIRDEKNLAVMYFSESINGLNVGSPVVYEGVQVGKVVNIEIHTDPHTLEFSIPVYVLFSSNGDISSMSFDKEISRRTILNLLIEKGLRARLASQNFLTGQLMIELLMLPNAPVSLKNSTLEDKAHFEIPTTLSTIGGLSKDIQDLPLKNIVWRMDKVLRDLDTELPKILPQYATFGEKLNKYIDRSVPQTNQTLNQLNTTLKDLSAAAKSLNNLTDYLERHPDAILKGKKE